MNRGKIANLRIRASAGSGKTHQLTNRYLRLIAEGVSPDCILATTFTRKAAGEILNRVLKRLAEAAGDEAKATELAQQIETKADFTALLRTLTRQLHRVRIGTLDSFFISLASQFGLELGLPPGWSIIEEIDDRAMRDTAVERLLNATDAEILFILFERLTHGTTNRGVHDTLRSIVKDLYDIHQETQPACWKKIQVAGYLSSRELEGLLSKIEEFDLGSVPSLAKPRNEDLGRARSESWVKFLETGIAGKLFEGENAFRNKPISPELAALYQRLIAHAGAALLRPIALQTEATREFLDRFHEQLTSLKQAEGGLRFNEVTNTLKRGFEGQLFEKDTFTFRLDGAIDHLLLDEFQDTALAQWQVMQPIAQSITSHQSKPIRSFLCVGDAKQAIYGWRGGMAAIFDTLDFSLGKLDELPLAKSRRSAQPIIDVVNRVFGDLTLPGTDRCDDALKSWSRRFQSHTTAKTEFPGYVCLQTGPAQTDGQSFKEQRYEHCAMVARQIQMIRNGMAASRSMGILCRTNDIVERMIYELEKLGVEASDEAGASVDRSPAVESLLSLFTLADHPGHTIAEFHLKHSPFTQPVPVQPEQLRREILERGYGETALDWASRLAPACNRRDLTRLQQFVDLAFTYDARSTLRSSDFVAWVRGQRVVEPSAAHVRVMTIHAAKGLEFDAVVLPQLDTPLMGQNLAFVVGRDSETLEADFVCRYAESNVRKFLPADQQAAFSSTLQNQIEESLSLLYVAMTRAISSLYLFIPGPRLRKQTYPWYKLLLHALSPKSLETALPANSTLYEIGDAACLKSAESAALTPSRTPLEPRPIVFRAPNAQRRRNFDLEAPSRHEGNGQVSLSRLFDREVSQALEVGSLHHAWFASLEWIDDHEPTDEFLQRVADGLKHRISSGTWRQLDALKARFREFLNYPEIHAIFRRSSYDYQSLRVECERRFDCRDGNTIWTGNADRVVWQGDANARTGADVIDFKTDEIDADDSAALSKRIQFYRPQLDVYRRVMARLAGLSEERVTARIAFVAAGRVINV